MARTFRRTRTAHPISELNVTNLIDVAFTLLIVFMIAAPLIKQEQTVPMNLPSAPSRPQPRADRNDRFVAISVDAAGRFFVENGSAPVTLAELRRRLQAFAAETKPPVIRIRGDGTANWEKVAQVFNEAENAGLVRVTIDYQTKN
jgi:biopolymer transport protein ExbD